MKEDYLWDKSGDDAGIERLENALAAFRYRETAPPELPQKVFTLEKPSRRAFFRFGWAAFAGSAMLVLIVSFVWLRLSGEKAPVAGIVNGTNALKRAEKTAGDSFVAPRETIAALKPAQETKSPEETKFSAAAPKVIKSRQRAAPVARRREKTAADNQRIAEPEQPLTEEEQYAYDQVMLALTITGSKLKIVKDKVNNIEQQNAVVESSGR